jgi:hypothetical protein
MPNFTFLFTACFARFIYNNRIEDFPSHRIESNQFQIQINVRPQNLKSRSTVFVIGLIQLNLFFTFPLFSIQYSRSQNYNYNFDHWCFSNFHFMCNVVPIPTILDPIHFSSSYSLKNLKDIFLIITCESSSYSHIYNSVFITLPFSVFAVSCPALLIFTPVNPSAS